VAEEDRLEATGRVEMTPDQVIASCAAFLALHLLFYYVWTAANDPVYLPGHDTALPELGGAQ
jgi:CRISPR/Cas system-associated protein Csm6